MSYIYSRALVEAYSQAISSESILYALSNEMTTASMFLSKDRMKESSRLSRYGMMCVHLGVNRGEELWTWFLEDSPAKRLVQQQAVEMLLAKTSGVKCAGLSERYALTLSLQKMYPKKPFYERKRIYWRTDTTQSLEKSRVLTWVRIIFGKDFGYLHTPTCTANFAAPSMQKHKSCRNFVQVFGRPSPTNFEWMMGWPIGWTDLRPLVTGKFLLWRQQHFSDCTR